jgi:hypothetical protein
MKEKHDLVVLIKKKDVLELSTEYEITIVNQEIGKIFSNDDDHMENYQLLNELNVNDIETLVLVDNDLKDSNQEHHQNHFDDLKLIDFPVM